jgi:uncharacterized membrane protein YdjX (TVP38/TMEM64 family)
VIAFEISLAIAEGEDFTPVQILQSFMLGTSYFQSPTVVLYTNIRTNHDKNNAIHSSNPQVLSKQHSFHIILGIYTPVELPHKHEQHVCKDQPHYLP